MSKIKTSPNQRTLRKYVEITGRGHESGYLAVVDSDVVDIGSNFQIVASNAADIALQRGMSGRYDVFDLKTKKATPH